MSGVIQLQLAIIKLSLEKDLNCIRKHLEYIFYRVISVKFNESHTVTGHIGHLLKIAHFWHMTYYLNTSTLHWANFCFENSNYSLSFSWLSNFQHSVLVDKMSVYGMKGRWSWVFQKWKYMIPWISEAYNKWFWVNWWSWSKLSWSCWNLIEIRNMAVLKSIINRLDLMGHLWNQLRAHRLTWS